jgi:hypothetical protein
MSQADIPLLLDLDETAWSARLDRVERWLAATRQLQSAYGQLLEDTADDISEPHIQSFLSELLDVAREHESRVDDLYAAFGRQSSGTGILRSAGATVLGRTRELIGHLEGAAGGASSGAWRKLRELLLTNLDAIAGFAVTEQLGLALGMPAVVDITFPVLRRKTQDQLLLQELLLEMASNAILLDKDI